MNKEALLKVIVDKINADLALAKEAVKMTYKSATDSENIAECKYDTTGLEASYLVQGQARRAEELEKSLEAFLCLKVKPVQKVLLNALVTLQNESGNEELIYIGPASGGIKIHFEDREVTVVTPISPLGRALLAKVTGNQIELTISKKNKSYKILSVV